MLFGRCIVCVVFLSALCVNVSAQLVDGLQKLVGHEALRHASVGISVKRLPEGKSVCEYQSQLSLAPASLTKLFSTVFALDAVGAGYTYKTSLAYSGEIDQGVLYGNLVILPGGDPALESQYFPKSRFMERALNAIQQAGIKRVRGTVTVDLSSAAIADIPGSWLWEDIANYYGALYHPFNYRDNLYTLTLKAGLPGQAAQLVSVDPEQPGVVFNNRVVTDPGGKNDVWIYGGPAASDLLLKGRMTGKPRLYHIKGAMHHPATAFEGEFTGLLEKNNIVVEGGTYAGRLTQTLYSHTSPPLKEIVFFTNKRSVNLFAEAAGQLVHPDDFERAVKKKLELLNIDASGLILKDASGLSPFNAVPAAVFTDLLCWADRLEDQSFRESLPVGGIDGGLIIYADHPLLGSKLRAKTGSFSGVRALSGYLTTQRGEVLAFTVVINHFSCSVKLVQEIVRDFLVSLASE